MKASAAARNRCYFQSFYAMIYSEPSVEFDRYFHISLPIVTKHELVFPFPLGTFP